MHAWEECRWVLGLPVFSLTTRLFTAPPPYCSAVGHRADVERTASVPEASGLS